MHINLLVLTCVNKNSLLYTFFLWRFDPIPSYGLPLRDFAITLIGHITLGGALEDWSAGSRNLYLTTYNAHKRQIFLPQAGFKPTIPASQRPHTHAYNFFFSSDFIYKSSFLLHITGWNSILFLSWKGFSSFVTWSPYRTETQELLLRPT